ncbi:MAG: hypothetical protein OEL84_03035 [Nitrosopumilus sp.]|nr:hypothetical protein [Nitrosopumilus sp.]
MTDIIWGNGSKVLSANSFLLNVTHRKDGNKQDYSDSEKIIMTSADLPGLPQNQSDWDKESLKTCVIDAFLKCEVEQRNESGIVLAKVSHSGVGGY